MNKNMENPIKRRKTRKIWVGDVPVGGDAPIAIQTMTNTETTDVDATVGQILRAQQAGADIVRVSVPSMDAADAFGEIRKQVNIPLVADIHFDHRIALKVAEYGVDCLRINPGNIGRDEKVREVIDAVLAGKAGAREDYVPQRRDIPLAGVKGELSDPKVKIAGGSAARFAAAYATDIYADKLREELDERVGPAAGEAVENVREGLFGGGR